MRLGVEGCGGLQYCVRARVRTLRGYECGRYCMRVHVVWER